MPNILEHKYLWGLMAATALTLVFASTAAGAAEDTAYSGDQAAASVEAEATVADNEVLVTAPRRTQRGEYGAPIRDVSASREVSFSDLDLTTDEGAITLETRIRATARNLCRQLDVMHPVKATDSPPCYETAVEDAMVQASAAVTNARGMASDDGE